MKKVINLSEKTINYMREFNDRMPARLIVEDVAKELNIECDYLITSLQDLGIKKAQFSWDMKSIEIYL
jgi:hypothetical protein